MIAKIIIYEKNIFALTPYQRLSWWGLNSWTNDKIPYHG